MKLFGGKNQLTIILY